MTTLLMKHSVADYDSWFAVFTAHQDVRTQHGATSHRVLRDGNDVVICLEFPDAESIAAFRADPSLAAAMKEAGVVSVPEATVLEEADARDY
ncbi:MAG: hypothetical protein U0R23_06040 [Candidatus Nanopelagicales bacterium]